MTGRTFVRDQAIYNAMFDTPAKQAFTNDEFYLRMVDGFNGQIIDVAGVYYHSPYTTPQANPGPEPEFYALYKEDDVRKKAFFRTKTEMCIRDSKKILFSIFPKQKYPFPSNRQLRVSSLYKPVTGYRELSASKRLPRKVRR